ncbi:MAG: cysteine desulfurase [Oscillospiraceae bacterium]|nr:cysteine desulfurase [Oscillospiraceae bacterium]
MIYFDNAATTKMCKEACKAMFPLLEELCGNPSSAHEAGQAAASALFTAHRDVAGCFGCEPNEIFFTSCGSEGDTMALLSAAEYGASQGKRHIISQKTEHHAVLNTLKALEKHGFEITLLDVDEYGMVSPENIARYIRTETALVTIMTANNEIGTIQPIAEIGKICRDRNVLFHTDAVQAAGHIPLNVTALNCDMLTISAHKFHGPKGVGPVYIRRGVPVTPLIYGGGQERGKRGGTENLPAIVGMAAALKHCVSVMDERTKYISTLRDRLIDGISELPNVHLNGHPTARLCGNVSFCFRGIEGERLVYLLNKKGICCSSASACSSGLSEPSHVMLAIGRSPELAKGSLRLSLSEYNTAEEIETVISEIRNIIYNL